MPQDIAAHVDQLLATYADPSASVAWLLGDRHPADAVAHVVVGPDLTRRDLTYGELREASERFAAALSELGVGVGDRVATLLGKSVEHLVVLHAIWRVGAVHVPLFTAFAPPAIAMRLHGSGAKLVVCDESQRAKLAAGGEMLADPPWRIVVTGAAELDTELSFAALIERHEPGYPAAVVDGDAPLIEIYTSGTTGRPKGIVVPKKALAGIHAYTEYGLYVRPDDVFWDAADPGWGYGLYYGVLGPRCLGVPNIWLCGGFSAERTFAVLSALRVTNFAAAPTTYRSLCGSGIPVPRDLVLRRASAAGEPLTPDVNEWAVRELGVLVHDHYGQTETGMLVCNHHHPDLRRPVVSGAMGIPTPGWTAAVLRDDRDEVAAAGTVGRLALDLTASPLAWFTGYRDEPAKTADKFTVDGRWYLTGDSVTVDDDGTYRFLARDDDVIIMAGYRIGPLEVESVLLAHPAVGDTAVIAAPDRLRGEVLEAYVVPSAGRGGTPELAAELQQWVKRKFAAHAYPRTVHFVPELPRTPSGKVQRQVLRQRRRAELAEQQT